MNNLFDGFSFFFSLPSHYSYKIENTLVHHLFPISSASLEKYYEQFSP